MTTTSAAATGTASITRRARLGAVGGALWALSPVAWLIADPSAQDPGTLSSVAVHASFWLTVVAGPALIVVGLTALRSALGGSAGPVGASGIALSGTGLAAVAVGSGIELVSLGAGDGTSVTGYVVFYVGFLVAWIGALLLGIAVLRRRHDGVSTIAAWLLALAVPLGIALGLLLGMVAPDTEAGFAAAVAVPTGVAWVLLGRSLAASPTR